MQVSIIAAISNNLVIGKDGALPWHIPEDLAWFKRHTMGKPVVMGRKTFESIGRALPNRDNIIISNSLENNTQEYTVYHDVQTAFDELANIDEIMIIGGQQIYEETLPIANKLYLTLIDQDFKGDTYFPNYTEYSWKEIFSTKNQQTKDGISYKHVIFERA